MMADAFEWRVESPDAHGLNSNCLETLWADLEARGTNTFLVVRHNRIVFERYAEGWDAGKKHYTASLAKALVMRRPMCPTTNYRGEKVTFVRDEMANMVWAVETETAENQP